MRDKEMEQRWIELEEQHQEGEYQWLSLKKKQKK